MKKTLTMLLALALTLSLAAPAFAAEDKIITGTGDETYTKDTQLPLIGEITDSAVLISVVMPTSMAFTIGTESAQTVATAGTSTTPATTGNKFSTLISGTGTVTNNSNKAIKLDIVGVTDTQELLKKVDLALAAGSDISQANAMANKLVATATAEAPIPLAERIAASGSSVALNVFGQGLTGTYSGTAYPVNLSSGNFTVTTTLKVSIAA